MTVYLITNLVNGKRYVGQTSLTLRQRWKSHCRKNSGCIALVSAIEKYGRENFSMQLIIETETREQSDEFEKEYIRRYCTKSPNGYNLTDGGEGLMNPSSEIRKKLSEYGHIQGCKNRDSGQLAFITTKEVRSKGGRAQGLIQGRRNVESGFLASLRTVEHQRKAGRAAGKKNVMSGQIQALQKSDIRKEPHKKYLHERWHVNRSIINSNCSLCKESQ